MASKAVLNSLLIYYAVMSLAAFAAFGLDKRRAVKGRWRIRERTLILLCLAGGMPGAAAGMRLFRHKTRKWYFTASLFLAAAIHGALLYFVFLPLIFT